MGTFGASKHHQALVGWLWRARLVLVAAALMAIVAACWLVAVKPSLAGVQPSLGSRAAPDLGLTKKTAVRARAGRTYTVTLADQTSQRWLAVRDPYDPAEGCVGKCPFRAAGPASALVGVTVESLGGTCVALATLRGPILNETSGNVADRRLAHGLVASGTTLAAFGVPTTDGRVYLELRPDSEARCSDGRYAVRFSVERALASGSGAASDSASGAQYGDASTALERRQAICAHKGTALDKYTNSLNHRILADLRRRGRRRLVARLKAAIRTATSKFLATPCPPRA